MNKTYGYCRISRDTQEITRQIRNILAEYPDADIRQEAYTGRKVEGRTVYAKLCHDVERGDTIVFDSVSRMSRNAAEGWEEYKKFYDRGVKLVFLKEHHIDTATYNKALTNSVPMTGTMADCIIKGVNEFLLSLAEEQVKLAFAQAEKEVTDLQQRTREGIETARRNGKQIGQVTGSKLNVKKALPTQERIRKLSRDFDGTFTDGEVMEMTKISRNTYYKYKKQLTERLRIQSKQAEIDELNKRTGK